MRCCHLIVQKFNLDIVRGTEIFRKLPTRNRICVAFEENISIFEHSLTRCDFLVIIDLELALKVIMSVTFPQDALYLGSCVFG